MLRVYGVSDDLIEFDGDFRGEVNDTRADENDGTLVVMSDGSALAVKYGKPGNGGVWGITVMRKGPLFDRLDPCTDEEADPYSDVVYFRDGIMWAYAAKSGEWEAVS